jgi:hypothetical protein
LLQSEGTKELDFILAAAASTMATKGERAEHCFWFC